MLRVGLTGDLGSGKTTVARQLAEHGARVFSSDEMGRAMMQPGEEVYAAIVAQFGSEVLAADHSLDRRKLAALAFDETHPRIEELNAIIHPAVIQAQEEQIAALAQRDPHAIVVVESALIFSTNYGSPGSRAKTSNLSSFSAAESTTLAPPPWRSRFDTVLLVTAPQRAKIDRFVKRMAAGRELSEAERAALEDDAARRLMVQNSAGHAADCRVIDNDRGMAELEQQVDAVWRELQHMERSAPISATTGNSGFSAAVPKS